MCGLGPNEEDDEEDEDEDEDYKVCVHNDLIVILQVHHLIWLYPVTSHPLVCTPSFFLHPQQHQYNLLTPVTLFSSPLICFIIV